MTGWHMILLGAPDGQTFDGGKKSEWLFIDPQRIDRFGHEGDTIIPGCCDRWKHLHREKISDANAVLALQPDNEDELPWQVRQDLGAFCTRWISQYHLHTQA